MVGLPPPPPVGDTALRPGTFAGQTVFVTGGGTGLGKAIASCRPPVVTIRDQMSKPPFSLDE